MDINVAVPFATTGIQTTVVALVALLFGSTLEKFFAGKPDHYVFAQLFLLGAVYDLIREIYKPDPEAWVVFASAVFSVQPTVWPRVRRVLNM